MCHLLLLHLLYFIVLHKAALGPIAPWPRVITLKRKCLWLDILNPKLYWLIHWCCRFTIVGVTTVKIAQQWSVRKQSWNYICSQAYPAWMEEIHSQISSVVVLCLIINLHASVWVWSGWHTGHPAVSLTGWLINVYLHTIHLGNFATVSLVFCSKGFSSTTASKGNVMEISDREKTA